MLRIFLTNLGRYNEGRLIGEWVELPCTDNELEAVKEISESVTSQTKTGIIMRNGL